MPTVKGAVSASLPPPVGGWNTKDALADMPPTHAVIMDNWFPGTDKVTLRKGSASHAGGMTGSVETLLEYVPLTGSGKLFACNNGSIYDVSSSGAVGTAAVTGQLNNKYQQVQIGTAGGQFLLIMNGQDTPQTYDGTTWADTTITGPTVANLIWCNLHQRRLWFGEKESLTAWYLDVNSITGAASSFSFAGVAKLGGYIMAMGTWTRDAGDGQDDVAVFLTSEGEALVYSGTDPNSDTTWSLVGVFRIGKPIGRRCMIKSGADLVMVTQDGFVTAATILSMDRSQTQKVALSAQINKAVNDAVQNYGSLDGWQPFLYPRGTMLLFNIPQGSSKYCQFVFNTLTGAPARFTGMNAVCWGLLNDVPYFGGTDGKVYKFDTGHDDNGSDIQGDALQAFNYFKSPGRQKAFKLVEPIFQGSSDPMAALDLNLDFQIAKPSGLSEQTDSTAALWDSALWDSAVWGSDNNIYRGWRGVRGIGRAAALRVRVGGSSTQPSWVATQFLYVPGGAL